MTSASVQIIDLARAWIWRIEHPGWNPDDDWQQLVTCVCVDAGPERWLIDPLVPPEDFAEFWNPQSTSTAAP
jgi:hypothetical protein